jgi:DNA-directed RNA polymerase sigma subunit (sigma70/sigma32)
MARPEPDDSDALKAYLRAIARIPRLTAEEERELGTRVKANGDEAALRRLVEGNLRFVVSYAKRYRGLGVPFLDLIHEGNLGLMEAARRFDPERNVKFITYACGGSGRRSPTRCPGRHAPSRFRRSCRPLPRVSGVKCRN